MIIMVLLALSAKKLKIWSTILDFFGSNSYLLPSNVLQVSIHKGGNTTSTVPGISGTIITYSVSMANKGGLVI